MEKRIHCQISSQTMTINIITDNKTILEKNWKRNHFLRFSFVLRLSGDEKNTATFLKTNFRLAHVLIADKLKGRFNV